MAHCSALRRIDTQALVALALNRVPMTPSDQWGMKAWSRMWWTSACASRSSKQAYQRDQVQRQEVSCMCDRANVCLWTVMLPLWPWYRYSLLLLLYSTHQVGRLQCRCSAGMSELTLALMSSVRSGISTTTQNAKSHTDDMEGTYGQFAGCGRV